MSSRKPVETTVYVLELDNGDQRRITVPSSWKVTFGPAVPYRNKVGGVEYTKGYALRFYEGENKQRAIFTDVKSFRDASIPILERVTKSQQQTMRKRQGDTGYKDVLVEARVTEWVNPDDPDSAKPGEEFLRIEDHSKVAF